MSLFDAFRYDGKRVLVVGGATGMGAAAAELALDAGAEVVVMDFAEVKLAGAKAIHVNLGEKESINKAVDECGGPVHALDVLRRRGRRDTQHREDQLRRAPPPDPAHARRGHAPAGCRHRLHLLGRRPRLGGQLGAGAGVPRHARLRLGVGVGHRARLGRLLPFQAGRAAATSPGRPSLSSSRASASTPSALGRRTPRWRRRTRRCGWASAPTTARRPGSRPRPRSSRPTRCSSCAATLPPPSPARR